MNRDLVTLLVLVGVLVALNVVPEGLRRWQLRRDAWYAQHPEAPATLARRGQRRRRLLLALVVSILLILNALVLVQVVVIPWWTAAPDTVQVTVAHQAANGSISTTLTTTFERTVHNAALAQRLQLDLAALPTLPPNVVVSCQDFYTYDTYTLTWSRASFFVEQASTDTPGCTLWGDFTLILHQRTHLPWSDAIFVDMHAPMGVPLPQCAKLPEANCRLPAALAAATG